MITYYGKTYLTTTEAAKLTVYSPQHIQRLAKEGKIEARKIGNMWAILKESVEAYKPTFKKPMIGKTKRESKYISKSTILNDRPLLPDDTISSNREKIQQIQAQAKTALYVDAEGNVIKVIERKIQ